MPTEVLEQEEGRAASLRGGQLDGDDGQQRHLLHRAHTRATRALPILESSLGHLICDAATLLAGLKLLSERQPSLKEPSALAKRAIREVEKLQWAVPRYEDDWALHDVAEAGFDHKAALLSHMRSQLKRGESEQYDDKALAHAFRAAVDEYKAGKLEDDNAGLERAALRLLRQHRADEETLRERNA